MEVIEVRETMICPQRVFMEVAATVVVLLKVNKKTLVSYKYK